MVCSAVQAAKRALLVVMRSLAMAYGLTLNCNRDSAERVIVKDLRKLALRTHPDRGGSTEDQQRLNDARTVWEAAMQAKGSTNSSADVSAPSVAKPGQECGTIVLPALQESVRKDYRVNTTACLLTYMNFAAGLCQWRRFIKFVKSHLKAWRVRHWCATLEKTREDKEHVHLMLQLTTQIDRTTKIFEFEKLRPNVQATDIFGEGLNRKRLQVSINRCFFYVWADKIGTCRDADGQPCVVGNYAPCWIQCFCFL